MVTLDFKALTERVGIVRILEVVCTCITFSLVASVGHSIYPFWTWSMFSWCFCFCVTIFILIVEFTSLTEKLPLSWGDFTSAFSLLASLMVMAASILYPMFFTCSTCGRQIAASVFAAITTFLYCTEVSIIRARPGEISGFLSTVPGLLKVLEVFVACIIFTCLRYLRYWMHPGLQWCVFVYSICFIFSFLIIILTICRLLTLLPAPFKKVLTVSNVLAVVMYFTAVIIWPVFSFKDNPRPNCPIPYLCEWNFYVVISVMTFFNLVAYIVDTVYSLKLSFIITSET